MEQTPCRRKTDISVYGIYNTYTKVKLNDSTSNLQSYRNKYNTKSKAAC